MSEPRVWAMPPEPNVPKVIDRYRVVWMRDTDVPAYAVFWRAPGTGMNAHTWADLLARRGPVVEVL